MSRSTGKLDKDEFKLFLTGKVGLGNANPNPDPRWLTQKVWDEICHLEDLPAFSGEYVHLRRYQCWSSR
jgi:hypothetical protein